MEDITDHNSLKQTSPGRKNPVIPSQTKENQLIDELYSNDYYDYSDYYDGLDGEYSDIDFNDIRDYFED